MAALNLNNFATLMKPLTREMEGTMKTQKLDYAAGIASIMEARTRIAPFIHQTPVVASKTLDSLACKQLVFKCECLQRGGAYKIRGASNAIFALEDDEAANGVVAHSTGNHAGAVSLAASLRGIPAYIVIPKNAPKCKVENVRRYGGQVILSEDFQLSESTANMVQQETGAVLIHPFNNKHIISGQGTIGLELLEQVSDIDTIIAPVSGGGLISGVAIAAKAMNPSIRIFAAEPKGADDAARSKAAGRMVTIPEINTIADGLRGFLGDLTWPVVRDLVDDVITVDDEQIIEATKMCFEILKLTVEPSGAIGLAAALSRQFQQQPGWKDMKKVAIIISGGNVDLGMLWDSFKN